MTKHNNLIAGLTAALSASAGEEAWGKVDVDAEAAVSALESAIEALETAIDALGEVEGHVEEAAQ